MRSFTRSTVVTASAAAAFALLTGCGGSSSSSDENAGACTSFETAQNEFVGLVEAGPGTADNIDAWTTAKNDAVDKMKALPASATGEVASAITTFVDGLPADTLDLSSADSDSGTAYKGNVSAIAAACEAEGISISLDELPTVTFGN